MLEILRRADDIEDWFRSEAGNCGAAYVLDVNEQVLTGRQNISNRLFASGYPVSGMLHHSYGVPFQSDLISQALLSISTCQVGLTLAAGVFDLRLGSGDYFVFCFVLVCGRLVAIRWVVQLPLDRVLERVQQIDRLLVAQLVPDA